MLGSGRKSAPHTKANMQTFHIVRYASACAAYYGRSIDYIVPDRIPANLNIKGLPSISEFYYFDIEINGKSREFQNLSFDDAESLLKFTRKHWRVCRTRSTSKLVYIGQMYRGDEISLSVRTHNNIYVPSPPQSNRCFFVKTLGGMWKYVNEGDAVIVSLNKISSLKKPL